MIENGDISINEEFFIFEIKLDKVGLIIGELMNNKYRFRLITDKSQSYISLNYNELKPIIKILNEALKRMKDD